MTPTQIIATQFDEDDVEEMCISLGLAQRIATAFGWEPPGDDCDLSEDDEERLAEADVVLAALIEDGLIRRSELAYVDGKVVRV